MKININDNILFARVGWMKNYNGLNGDSIKGGGTYVDKNNIGWEIYNFTEENGVYYGYVRNGGCIDIHKNFNAQIEDDFLDNIIVVWLANDPNGAGTKIIGWYKNARVYKYYKEPPKNTKRFKNDYDMIFEYNIEAHVKDCTLLPIDERIFNIPKAKTPGYGIGRANVWYCKGDKNKNIKKDVVKYINNYKNPKDKSREKLKKKKINIQRKQKVEQNAIEYVKQYYEELGYDVSSVELDNIGWDLTAIKNEEELYIGVKGLSSNNINIGLTPNEYKYMKNNSKNYRLSIVTNALDLDNIKLNIFLYNQENNKWEDENGDILNINEIISANIKVNI